MAVGSLCLSVLPHDQSERIEAEGKRGMLGTDLMLIFVTRLFPLEFCHGVSAQKSSAMRLPYGGKSLTNMHSLFQSVTDIQICHNNIVLCTH